MLRKVLSVILSVVMAVSVMSVAVSAEEMQTSSVMQEFEASAVKWNGKSALKAGKTYAVTSNLTVSKKIEIPSGTTLIAMKGAKLWINGNGSLFVKGKLNIKSGATLAVTGRLYQYKSKSILNYGEIRFSNKANITLNGKTTIYSTGSITGTPKTLSVGANAAITCKGKNDCGKLDKYIDRTAMEARLDGFFTKAVQNSDVYGAMKYIMSDAYISDLDKTLQAFGGITFEQLCDSFGGDYVNELLEQEIDPKTVTAITVKLTSMKSSIADENLRAVIDSYYGGAKKCYSADCEVTVKTTSGSYTETVELTMVEYKGKWYLLG